MTTQPAAGTRSQPLLVANFAGCVLLLVQYLLGMATNLFVMLPQHHPGANAANYFSGVATGLGWVITHGTFWAAIHAVFGLALIVAAVANIVLALRRRIRSVTVTSVLGALAVVGAGFNGMSFVNYGHDLSSMIMAALWAVALACYLIGGYVAARRTVD